MKSKGQAKPKPVGRVDVFLAKPSGLAKHFVQDDETVLNMGMMVAEAERKQNDNRMKILHIIELPPQPAPPAQMPDDNGEYEAVGDDDDGMGSMVSAG